MMIKRYKCILYGWKKLIGICLVVFALTSCVKTKDIIYFQPNDPSLDEITSKIDEKYIPKIQKGDILSIIVSSLDKNSDEMFNPISQQTYQNTNQSTGTTAPAPIVGFQVDVNGKISLPILGQVSVEGLTSQELSKQLTEKLGTYLESPTVIVRIANFKISVLGEVARPSVYTIPNESITLPEAIAMAGDLTPYGKRKNILIIRETSGNREFVRIDITKRDIFNTPYYYLHPGDIVYVEPSAGKITTSDRAYQLAPIITSSLSLLIVILTAFL